MEIAIMPFGMYQELEYGRRLLVVGCWSFWPRNHGQ